MGGWGVQRSIVLLQKTKYLRAKSGISEIKVFKGLFAENKVFKGTEPAAGGKFSGFRGSEMMISLTKIPFSVSVP